MRGSVCAAAMAVWLSQPVAAPAQEGAERPLGTVVVTATRTEAPLESVTQSISVVSDDEMQNRQAVTVTEALRDVPGVDIAQPGSPGTATSVFIRGAESDQTLFLVDGVKVNSPMLGGFNLGNMMTDNLGRIEVLRGAGGTLYGSEAVGGVVNLMTKKGEGAPHFSISSAGGNISTASELGALSGQSGLIAYSASLGYLTTAGFHPANDDFSVLTQAGRLDVTPIERGTFRAFWRIANSSLGLANNDIASGINLLDPDARERDEFYLGEGEWEHQPIPNLTYRISGAYARTVNVSTDIANTAEQAACLKLPFNQQLQDPLACFGPAYFRSPSYIAGSEGQVNYTEGTTGISTLGIDFKSESGAFKSIPMEINEFSQPTRFAHTRYNVAGYAQQQLFLFDNRFTAVGGVRVDGNQDFGREVSASWSVGYIEDWNSGGRWTTHIKGGYAEGFRAPSFSQTSFPRTPFFAGNPNLRPEISSEYDGGVEQHLGLRWLSVDGTYFTRRAKDLIVFSSTAQCPASGLDPTKVSSTDCNIGLADVRGVETAVRVGPIAGVSFVGSYGYLDWDLGGPSLLRRPRNRMASSLNYQLDHVLRKADHFDANVNVVFVGQRHDLDPLEGYREVSDHPMYTRTDLALRYDVPVPGHETSRIGGFARVQNLFDRNYEEVRGFKSPPINVLAGAEVTL
jgi:vitamin B12 transporter